MNCYEDLEWRGLIKDISSDELKKKLNEEKLTFYIGTDPTADSMHIGHFSSFLIASRLAKFGHKPILLIGGATGLIGDPKPSKERPMITKEAVEKNVLGLSKQAKEIFGFEVVNNYDWTKDLTTLDFLRDYGKYINVNYMLDKDIINRRLETGITFCEFAYTLLQGMDFVVLNKTKGVTLQVAGSDQWGNITTGIELARKRDNIELFGMTMPLVVDANGVKFGKTEGNALWLDKDKTSPYDLYQYLINTSDECVIDFLKKLTFLSKEEIEQIEIEHKEKPELRSAQKILGFEVIKFIHGEEEAKKAQETSEAIFSGKVTENMPTTKIKSNNILDILVESELAPSKSEARRLVEQGGVSIDNEKITDVNYIAASSEFVLQKGKKKIIKIIID